MKILMFTPLAPYPPNAGIRIRLWEQIRYLGQRHDLTVVSFVSPEEYKNRGMLDGYCNRAIMVLHEPPPVNLQELLQLPPVFQWYKTPEMTNALYSIKSNGFDLVIIEQIFMAQYHELFSTPTILQEHNIESNIVKQLTKLPPNLNGQVQGQQERVFRNTQWMLMARYENETWPKFPLRFTVSELDKQELDRRCPIGKTVVIENGINTEVNKPVESNNANKILFMGTMNYQPNVDAALYFRHSVLPKIWAKDPTASLVIAGRDPIPEVRDLARHPNIEVIPNPQDMTDVARNCCLTIVPLRSGGGTRIKIPHSMALGLPVVTTTLGCEGLTVTDGRDLLIRDDPDQFADAVLRLLADSNLRNLLKTSGRRLVEERYDWRCKFERLEEEALTLVNASHYALGAIGGRYQDPSIL